MYASIGAAVYMNNITLQIDGRTESGTTRHSDAQSAQFEEMLFGTLIRRLQQARGSSSLPR